MYSGWGYRIRSRSKVIKNVEVGLEEVMRQNGNYIECIVN
jgi:hypothetical protein